MLAKDYLPLTTFSTQFMVKDSQLMMLAHDAKQNVQIFTYAPLSLESRGGQMLVSRADFHLGYQVEKFIRVNLKTDHMANKSQLKPFLQSELEINVSSSSNKIKSSIEGKTEEGEEDDNNNNNNNKNNNENNQIKNENLEESAENSGAEKSEINQKKSKQVIHAALFGTLEGGVGMFVPYDEVALKKLLILQNKLVTAIPHFAGLNPKQFRAIKFNSKPARKIHSTVVDGELVWKFLYLDWLEQRKIARSVGMTTEQILEMIQEISVAMKI